MFPIPFAFEVVEKYCVEGGAVLDPFAGRGSSIYAAAVSGRYGCGIEINRVGWLYSRVKLSPGDLEKILLRNRQIGLAALGQQSDTVAGLPLFFHHCYTERVLRYLCAAREFLNWQYCSDDATLMAIILVYLHGAKEKSLSNQMRQSKAMAPEYSIEWWRKRQSTPPEVDPEAFLEQRIRWRYAKGKPVLHESTARFGNSVAELDNIRHEIDACQMPRFDLLFTSPPYYNVTSYHYDQWLRLWMLGHDPRPSKTGGDWQDGFWSQPEYRMLLKSVFTKCAAVMKPEAKVLVRTDAREFTRSVTTEILQSVFPDKELKIIESPLSKGSQTALFGDKTKKPGEIDLLLTPRH